MDKSLAAILLPPLGRVEEGFAVKNALAWSEKYWVVSIYGSLIYLALIVVGKLWMKDRPAFSLRRALLCWNTGLALFSFFGASVIIPNLIGNIYTHGLLYTFCHCECNSDEHTTFVLWGWLFALSKLVEFGDTFFIVLRKAPLSFLHWYHHVTVCIYTWYSITPPPSPLSSWFGGMNYTVHTFMYTYYALRTCGFKLHPLIAKVVTTVQLSQMFFGILINFLAWYASLSISDCVFVYERFYLAGVMYTSYAILFANYFYQRYLKKTPSVTVKEATPPMRTPPSVANGEKTKQA